MKNRETNFSQDQIEAFLLGECEEELALLIEEHLFSDDEFYHKMEAAKSSLIAREIAGTLLPMASSKLNLQIQRSAALRVELEQMRAFSTLPARSNASRMFSSMFTRQRMKPILSIVYASILLAVVGVLFASRGAWKGTSYFSSQKEMPASSQQKSSQTVPKVFFLSAEVLRSASAVPVLHLERSGQPVELQIEVRGGGLSHQSVDVMRGRVPVLHQDDLEVKTEGPLHYVIVDLQPGMLRQGEYTVRLSFTISAEASQVLTTSERTFDVVTKSQ